MSAFKGVRNRGVNKIPKLDAVVGTSSNKMRSDGVEIDSTKPVLVAFSGHNIFASVHVPDFPRAVVRHSSDNLFTHVKGETRNGSGVSLNSLA